MNPNKISWHAALHRFHQKYIANFFSFLLRNPNFANICINFLSYRNCIVLAKNFKKKLQVVAIQIHLKVESTESDHSDVQKTHTLPVVVVWASSLRVLSSRDNLRLTRTLPALRWLVCADDRRKTYGASFTVFIKKIKELAI